MVVCLCKNVVTVFSCSICFRLRAGNVIFNYRYYNNRLQKTEGVVFLLLKIVSFVLFFSPSNYQVFTEFASSLSRWLVLNYFSVALGVVNFVFFSQFFFLGWILLKLLLSLMVGTYIVLLFLVIFLPLIQDLSFFFGKILVFTLPFKFWCYFSLKYSSFPVCHHLISYYPMFMLLVLDSLICSCWIFTCSNWRLLLPILLG